MCTRKTINLTASNSICITKHNKKKCVSELIANVTNHK